MYATYTYNSAATSAYIVEDLAEILKGTTDSSTLPGVIAGVVEGPGTVITTSHSISNWIEVEKDLAVAEPWVVLKAPIIDDPLVFKFLRLVVTNTGIRTEVYEDWNVDPLFTGVNPAKYSTTWEFNRTGAGSPGIIHISSSERHALFNVGAGDGILGSRFGPFGVVEYTRRNSWDTVGNGFPPFAFFAPQSITLPSLFPVRTLDAYYNQEILNSESCIQSVYAGGSNNNIVNQQTTVDVNRTLVHTLIDFGHSNASLSNEGGDISAVCPIKMASSNVGLSFDEILVGPITYTVWVFFSGSQTGAPYNPPLMRWAIIKG